jgi:hypothetical protein
MTKKRFPVAAANSRSEALAINGVEVQFISKDFGCWIVVRQLRQGYLGSNTGGHEKMDQQRSGLGKGH